jgi:sterol 3beta-glucosyltransferase
MKITMLTIGTRGEVQPMVALGLGLQAAGHKISIATHATFETFVRDLGLGFSLIDVDKEMQKRAAALGERIRAENGVAKAVEIICSTS